ncbi:MAG: TIGR04282 family arsenosugar biosynthesis glycosyltransferase [Nitrospiria bacterium]
MRRSARSHGDWALAIFAKAPIPGQIKTRLVPPLTPECAARLHGAFVGDILDRTAALGWTRYLACAPDITHPFLRACAQESGALPIPQGEGDLGARLNRVIGELLRRHDGVIVIGADSPSLPVGYLEQARTHLAAAEVVLGPAEDGGYYLIGLQRAHPALFEDIPWGSSEVFSATAAKVGTSRLALLPLWYDVDRPSDLDRLRADVMLTRDCPRTRAVLESCAPALTPAESRP